jgi:hypothetical protein
MNAFGEIGALDHGFVEISIHIASHFDVLVALFVG